MKESEGRNRWRLSCTPRALGEKSCLATCQLPCGRSAVLARQSNGLQGSDELFRVLDQGLPLGLTLHQGRAGKKSAVEGQLAGGRRRQGQGMTLGQARAQHQLGICHGQVVADERLALGRSRVGQGGAAVGSDSSTGLAIETEVEGVELGGRKRIRAHVGAEDDKRHGAGIQSVGQHLPRRTRLQPGPHLGHWQHLQVTMGLAGARVGAAVEEGKELAAVGTDAGPAGIQVVGLEQLRLRLEGARGEDEVLRHNGKLVEDEVVRLCEAEVGLDPQLGRRIGEGVGCRVGDSRWPPTTADRLLGQRRGEAKLELETVPRSACRPR